MVIGFYGPLRDLVAPELSTGMGGALRGEARTVAEARDWLARAYPAAAAILHGPRVRFSLDDRLVGTDAPLAGAARLDILPPLSGG